MMTEKELKEIGITRTEWNAMLNQEIQYIENWIKTVNRNEL